MKCHFGHFNCNMIWELETLGQTAYLLASFHRNGCTKASQILKVYRWVYHIDDTLNFCASHVARPWMPHPWSKVNIFILTLLASCFNHKLSKARFLDSLDDKLDRSGDHGLFSTSRKIVPCPNLLGSYDLYVFFQAKLNISPVTVNCPPIYLSCSGFMKNGNTLGKTPANVGIEMARMLKWYAMGIFQKAFWKIARISWRSMVISHPMLRHRGLNQTQGDIDLGRRLVPMSSIWKGNWTTQSKRGPIGPIDLSTQVQEVLHEI